MRYSSSKKIICCIVGFVTLMILLRPGTHGRRSYDFIAKEDILDNLHEEISSNFTSSVVIECNYRDVLEDETTLSISLVNGDLNEGHKIRESGEYAPHDCKPKYSTAVIVPYRDRPEQLRGFLVYMHSFFRRQKIHYKIYVIEQVDTRAFNRAKLMNIGAVAAMKAGFPCLVFHDVDLLPLKPANIYACTERPRHLSASVDKFRFVLPYLNLFGGAIAIVSKQYQAVNGMSNQFFGWGGEDDDFYVRLRTYDIEVCRFEPALSVYHMFNHRTEKKGERRSTMLSDTKAKIYNDGLSTLQYTEVAIVLHPLFTHIMVDL